MSGMAREEVEQRTLFYHQQTALQAVRSGPWKLHFPHQYRHQAETPGINGKAAGQIDAAIGLSLYNLEEDVGEQNNLAEKYPIIVQRLMELADAHMKDLAENSRAPLAIEDVNWRRYKEKLEEGEYITDWWLIGPFNNADRKGIEKVYPPEEEFIIDKNYTGRNNQLVSWRKYDGKSDEYISLAKLFKPSDEGVAYARRIFNLKNNTVQKIGLGTNDGVKMWVNGKLVHTNIVGRPALPNEDVVSVQFHKGENIVLLKVDQLGGGWGFYFSLLD
jgi:hypothetical protein